LKVDGIKVSANKHPTMTRAQLTKLAVSAWCEVFGLVVPSDTELKEMADVAKARVDQARQQLIDELRGGSAFIVKWNQRKPAARTAHGPLRKADLW
jgi:hypothetical protein